MIQSWNLKPHINGPDVPVVKETAGAAAADDKATEHARDQGDLSNVACGNTRKPDAWKTQH